MPKAMSLSAAAHELYQYLTTLPLKEVTLQELARDLSMSRSKIKRALFELEDKGLLTIGENNV